jgi:serine/threonine protein kinase
MRPMSGWTPPTEFDEFRLLTPLGRGGMSQVFTAQDVFLDRLVAVKFLLTADIRKPRGWRCAKATA